MAREVTIKPASATVVQHNKRGGNATTNQQDSCMTREGYIDANVGLFAPVHGLAVSTHGQTQVAFGES